MKKVVLASLSLFVVFAMSPSRTAAIAAPVDEESLCKVWVCEDPESTWWNATVCADNCNFACDVAFVC